ncbi:hypothetical protein SEA_YABOI_121 [Streptomyces phage Yaboi]|uniref:Uncharacterized protein n=3 Tax=Streptomyces virus Yaboi TaxID=2846408 RepID=A0A385UKF6_9CAUD|nr:hypothetical protein HWB86_gp170 [Streptomyces phage Yaboi]QAY08773.1 hypothetical protein SEA_GENIE2_121 [Streptomyces phage Genie2]QAY12763.1 hypothetical protein SEA_BOOMERJR_121 [Streptomyces phage BoomerJR]UVD39958.1 hypothetical protein SEA_STANIMAL_120 [Streptomyces phage Stanimal]WNM73699.1 hypothetical protein SEA_SOLLERTIA_120 [Streptomyces phage Sollertia]AYB70949.1 hypothetical protein SEA_YABOI_121 [Streptomyces phage Yaboi]
MNPEEEIRFYENLKRDLPGKERELSQLERSMRGKSGDELKKIRNKATILAMEIGGMKNTMKAIRHKRGLK